ncbi:exonuclease subunit SbcD [Rheinheimera sp. EpRS3]|uniref:exonuclease subunit SbcD n=1 Tax=Rheinheimera sp. EpRS3 TaxID=1712383 RepID=UPI00074B09DA|nr:exonuclease subunit SbcD [Rheinheimera sp. EpRS3]KUM52018.1 exonuclease sbcCD subunit D [Rheinheimera sp. EpRS3]
MRILHTSDWHLGQHFIGRSRQAEHQAFLTWLVQQVTALNIDAIVVAGDIFDTATPPSYARELYNQFIVELQGSGCQLVILGGNHDAAAVLNESKNLLHYLNTRVVASSSEDLTEQLVLLDDQQKQPAALLCAVPFLRARDLLQSQGGQSARDKQLSLQQAIAQHYQQLYVLAQGYNIEHQLQLPIIMTGHLTTVGVSTSESVRDIYIGTLDAFPADAFPPADYIALGHIHQSQQLKAATDIRYSGSPIALSFDEAKAQKQLWLLEFNGAEKTVSSVPVPCFQPLCSIKTSLADVPVKVQQALQGLPEGSTLWLELVISEIDAYLTDLQQRVEQLLQGLPVQLLRLRRQRSNQAAGLTTPVQQSLSELTPEQVWQTRLQTEILSDEQQQQLTILHRQVLAKVEQTA